ncbi:restriction endonuclease subunit S [Azonexus sp.]|uniref:restriction endonuclease subunit S n=1 Tax=Azonexus sp. TaxID=1872668 RepID=UPI0027B9DC9D|nr:restriction endonuclease subunit S [Azonexus sp.]
MELGELPAGWEKAELSEICLVNPTIDKSAIADDLVVSFVPMPAVEAESGVIDVSATRKFGEVKKGYTPFREGDVLFAKITPCMENGKMAVVPALHNGLGFGSTEFHVLRAHPGISPQFVYYFVSSRAFRHVAEHNMSGAVGQRRVTTPYLSACKIPVPPTAEQHRIVAKIEELFSELDQGVASLKTAREQLKVYRQSLLKNAFEGKLTAAWRAAHRDQLESAAALQQRINREREARHQQQLADWQTAGQSGPKPKPPKPLPPLTVEELAVLPVLPEGWGWVRLETIQAFGKHAVKAGPFGSALKKEFYVSDGFKIYGQEQVIRGDHAYGDYFISESKYADLSSCAVRPFDVLISLVGTIGKVLVLPELARPGIINPRLVKISLNLAAYEPAFFKAYFESGFLRSLYATESQGTTMDILNLGMIQGLPYPLCSLDEQREILSVLDAKLSEADQLDQTLATALQQADALRQSILKKAFHGQLVKQAKNEEPATALLERIRAERSASPAKGRQAKLVSKPLTNC